MGISAFIASSASQLKRWILCYFTVFLYLSFFFLIIIINVWGQEWFAIAMQSCSYTMSHSNAPIIQKFDQLEFNDG